MSKEFDKLVDVGIGITDLSTFRIVPLPLQVWQLVGAVPDCAVLARDEHHAHVVLVDALSRELTEADVVKRIR